MIPRSECKDRHLYRIKSRNLRLGVFRESTGGFLGLREKYDRIYVFEEYHWENAAFATVQPIELLPEVLPADIMNVESLGTRCTHCQMPIDYVYWPEGGEREVPLQSGGTISVPGEWTHVAPTDCQTPIEPVSCPRADPVDWTNMALETWLHEMEAKYPR
jgi:hypothetical protein